MVWRAEDPQCNEVGKMLWELVPYTRGLVLDLGCGPTKGFPHFIGIDNKRDTALFNIAMNPDITVPDACKLTMFADGAVDAVFSSHLLEHVVEYRAALREWWRVIKEGGHLCLYLPHKDLYPNIGQPGGNKDHKHDFLPQDILDVMDEAPDWDLVRNEDRNEREEYSFFQVFKKLPTGQGHKFRCKEPKPKKTCGVVRYGAWGDTLQSCSVFPGLKKQGFHITLYTTPRAWESISQDPHVDEVILQDTDQVPNHALGPFWANEAAKYDRWVNLSASVEDSLLVLENSARGRWPTKVRHKHLNINYVQLQHELAEVPYGKPQVKFYATQEEKDWALERRIEFKAAPLILWVLNGSSIHKVWPHIDQIFARMLVVYPECKIVTIGDTKSLMLDEPWRNEPRIVRMAGQWSFRQTLSFAQVCDMIVGPETGVLNAMSMEEMPKIVFLSHSSHENLTRDWVNTFPLSSKKTSCYPCHKMHYTWDTCNRNEDKGKYWEGTAQCQVDLSPEDCWNALGKALNSMRPIERPIPRPKLELAHA
jgi:ADP-heptose:LPS heptosyltransferase/predicted SAM-dependent methyltransferase